MKKRIVPSIFCYVDMDTNEITRPSGKDNSDINTNTDSVKISLYCSKKRNVKKEWLKWLVYYHITLDKKNWERIWDLQFYNNPISNNMREEDFKLVVFKEPVYVDNNNEFRILARYPDYAISKDGRLMEITKGKIRVYDNKNLKNNYYPSLNIYDRSIGKSVTVLLHRLVALAWCENNNWKMYGIVNHKDKNKHNFHADNLEWISHSGNTLHANDEVSYDVHYLTRNIDTGIITKHTSLRQASEYIGRSRINTVTEPIHRSKIWRGTNGKFEMKLSTNTSSWLYEKAHTKKSNIMNRYFVKYKDNRVEIYYYIGELKDKFLKYSGHLSFEELKKRILKKHLDISTITQTDTTNRQKSYQAMNIDTKEMFTADTTRKLANMIGLGKTTVIKAFALNDSNRVFINYVFRPYSEEPWNIDQLKIVNNNPISFNILKNGKIIDTVKSTRELAIKYNINRHMLNSYFKNNKAYNHNNLIFYKQNIA